MRLLLSVLIVAMYAYSADWGAPVDGLRASLNIETSNKGERLVLVTFQNVQKGPQIFLRLGIVGVREADLTHLNLIESDGKRQPLMFVCGAGLAPGRILGMIVPLLPGSTYSIPNPLRCWVKRNYTPLKPELLHGASLQAELKVDATEYGRYHPCYPKQRMWAGQLFSNTVQSPR
jgi:hypothetical protein